MTKNMGAVDRGLRILTAVAIGVLYYTGAIGGLLAIILGIVALMFVVTSAVGVCPGYVPLGISTRKSRTDSARV